MSERTIEQQIADLHARVAALEAASEPEPASRLTGEIPPLIDRMSERLDKRIADEELDTSTTVVGEIEPYVLIKGKGGTWGWSEDNIHFDDLMAFNADALARSISGLAHPARIALAKALITGPKSSTDLLEIAGLNTTGQLYHHLQAMADVGLVERRSRNLWGTQNIGAFSLLMFAGYQLAKWRGDEGEAPDTGEAAS